MIPFRDRIPPRWVARWPTIRAVLVTYHVAAVALLAFPSPEGIMDRRSWRDRTVQNELRLWSGRLRAAGADVTPESLEESLWSAAQGYVAARRVVATPFSPYGEHAGPRQSWRLFVAPQRYPTRLEIDVEEAPNVEEARFRPVYAGGSAEHAWMRDRLEAYRMRRIVFGAAWQRNKKQYGLFCDWIARSAARDFPEATRVRVRQVRYRTPTPEEARAGLVDLEAAYEAEVVSDLGPLR